MKTPIYAAGALLALAAPSNGAAQAVGGAMAQQTSNFARDRNVAVRQRPHPEYEAVGGRLGAFFLYPQISVVGDYVDNLYAAADTGQSDLAWRVQPQVELESGWSRHALTAYARGSVNRFTNHSSENTSEYALGADGRLDIRRDSNISAGAAALRTTEPRTSSSSPAASIKPIQYDEQRAYVAGVREFNRLRVSGRGDVRRYDFDDGRAADGTVIQQDDRDRTVLFAVARGDYAISPATAVFVAVGANKRDYRLGRPAVVGRDSGGYEVLVGADFEIGGLMRGEVGAGYISQSYDDPSFGDINGFGGRAKVEWFPTQLTTVTLAAGRTVEDSGVVGASGYSSATVSAQIDHELRRNVILTAQTAYWNDDYSGVDRTDKRFTAGASATYLLNRRWGVTAGYTLFKQNSQGLQRVADFTVNRVTVSLTARF